MAQAVVVPVLPVHAISVVQALAQAQVAASALVVTALPARVAMVTVAHVVLAIVTVAARRSATRW
jgi:hypothetical protein